MADEISIHVSLALLKGELNCPSVEGSLNVTMAGDAMTHSVQQIGTGKEVLVYSADIETCGYLFLRNLDEDNYVEYGADANAPFGKLKAGECALLRLAVNNISMKANTAAVNVEFWIIED